MSLPIGALGRLLYSNWEAKGGRGAAGARCRTRDIPRVWTRSSAIVTCQRAGEVQRGFLAFGLSDPHMGASHWKRSFKYHIKYHRHLIYANQPTCSIQSDDIFSCRLMLRYTSELAGGSTHESGSTWDFWLKICFWAW